MTKGVAGFGGLELGEGGRGCGRCNDREMVGLVVATLVGEDRGARGGDRSP